MAVSRETVNMVQNDINNIKNQIPDGTTLKEQINLLRDKVEELKDVWNTSGGKEEYEKYQMCLNELLAITPPIRIIQAVKEQEITIEEVERTNKIF